MVKTRDEALAIARELKARFAEHYGPRLAGVYLYGSCARDEATEDSDVDIAVVIDGDIRRNQELFETSKMWADLSLEKNCVIIPFFLSKSEFELEPFPIDRSIRREGIAA